jgi:ankyrin repeat protein
MDAVQIVLSWDLPALQRLLEDDRDALLRRCTSSGLTLLMVAALSGSVDCVEYLLEAGADPNARSTISRETALMFATVRHRHDAMRRLIEAGADVNARDGGGATALHHALAGAARRTTLERTISLLVESGADTAIADRDGRLPAEIARRRKWAIRIPWVGLEIDGWRHVRRDGVVRLLESPLDRMPRTR